MACRRRVRFGHGVYHHHPRFRHPGGGPGGVAKDKGIDVIICDHHLPGATMPDAHTILNPKQPDCPYPFKELSGCGVAFKLIQALTDRIGLSPWSAYDGWTWWL